MFFFSFDGVAFLVGSCPSCCVVLPSFVGLRFPSLRLCGAAWSPPPLGGVAFPISFSLLLPSFPSPLGGTTYPPSSVGWCCLVHSSFGRCCFSNLLPGGAAFLPLQRSLSLLFGGAAWSPASLGGVAIPLSFGVELPSFRSLGRGRVRRLSCWVVLPSFSSFWWWCFLPSRLLGRAAGFSSIGRWCCVFLLL